MTFRLAEETFVLSMQSVFGAVEASSARDDEECDHCSRSGYIHCVEYVASIEECLRVSAIVAEAREVRRAQRHLAQQAELNREQTTNRHGQRRHASWSDNLFLG